MPLLTLVGQAVATFAASFGVGYLPLAFDVISGKRLNVISVFGMGLLVGAALTIIIPEGVDTLYSSFPEGDHDDHNHQTTSPSHVIGIALLSGFALMMMVESFTPHPPSDEHEQEHAEASAENGHYHSPSRSPVSIDGLPPSDTRLPLRAQNSHISDLATDSRLSAERMNSSTSLFPKTRPSYDTRRSRRESKISLAGDDDDEEEQGGLAGLNATLGLVIHAMADGIALGASSLSEKGGLGFVVFLAVIVHKGPTALGLTTTLLSQKLSRVQIRTRLLLFSASAPVGAILTYFLVKLFGGSDAKVGKHDIDGIQWWTGAVLLFSGGTFLYVATVISPLSDSDSHNTHAHAHTHDPEDEKLSKGVRLSLLVGGMILPLILSAVLGGHSH